ncbi:MAG: FecR domain-containing protein [Bacteroides sp.]|nr:FecR domain-containing protein [Bacteroides sp.]
MMELNKEKIRTDKAWKRLNARFDKDGLLPETRSDRTGSRLFLKWGAVAAVIAGAVCCVALWMLPSQEIDPQNLVTQENREKATLVKTLEDGSVIYLAQESTLQYPEHFAADKRKVNLQGEAFFDVAKKSEQAFLVETKKVRVEVLGTAFDVRSKKEDAFSLSVRRGRVKVSLKEGGQNVFVKAGETVTLENNSLILTVTGHSGGFDRYTKNIRFKDECLEDVLRAVNRESSDWQIETSSPALGKRKLTVEFSDSSPETVAELICWTFNLKSSRQGNKIVLSE